MLLNLTGIAPAHGLWGCGMVVLASVATSAGQQVQRDTQEPGCLECHDGIEPIRDPQSAMMQQIFAMGRRLGDPAGCVVCHGGDARATTKDEAHGGEAFYPDPGSPWINQFTCGPCHAQHTGTQWNSIMMTEAGKIQGTAWAFGSLEGYEHRWGNYDAKNPDDQAARLGTEAYKAYVQRLSKMEPDAFPGFHETMPEAPTDMELLKEHPELSAYTYHRTECQRCHLGVKGRQQRGDYRGMGCSACHIPYSNEGLYEGNDKSIPGDQPGHLLVHSLQASRDAKVTVNGRTYSGVPVETCTTCHDRGKRIGVTFQGLMESAYHSPYTEGGGGQLDLHSKHYIAMQEDVHYQKGMMCQDCHTSLDLHGDGFLRGTTLAQVEIECSDCHGTPKYYPWELPLGFMDEFQTPPMTGTPRGVARELSSQWEQGTKHPVDDGYLISARGNPFPEVVRRGNQVVVHTAGGKDLELKPLKLIEIDGELATEPSVAMRQIGLHLDTMECYSCHATWAPQCYGCHVKVDYSEEATSFDWVAAGQEHKDPEHAAKASESGFDTFVPGEVKEQRSYLRWEDPALGVNGEHRVTPVMPGCQVAVTVIGTDGETIVKNHIFRSTPGSEGSGPEGQLGVDMSPAQPHTTGHARTCESCHLSEKALGYGIGGGRLNRSWDEPVIVDLMTAEGDVLPQNARTQIEAVEGLEADWSRFVTEDGKQLQTVGHHFRGSRPLNNKERNNMDRRGLCLSCHQEIPTESLAVSLLHHVAQYADALPKTHEQHTGLIHKILLFSAWGQTAGAVTTPMLALVIVAWSLIRRRTKRLALVSQGATDPEAVPPDEQEDH